jgi:DNA-binding CsgD family transcriptional regulator
VSSRRALTGRQEQEAYELWLRRVPVTRIAERMNCHRNTVSATIRRVLEEEAEGRQAELERARNESIAVYQGVQQEAWRRLQGCQPTSNAAVGYLGIIADAQKQQDRLLGLEQLTLNVRGAHLAHVDALLDSTVPILLPGADDAA